MSLFSTCKWCVSFLNWTIQLTQFSLQTLGVYKACISQVHDPVVGQQLGSLPVVSRFMKGIFQLKPTTPRSCSTWSVGPVLRHLSALEPIEKIPLTKLSLKLTVLLALTSVARSHELAALDCNHISRKADIWVFVIPTNVKKSRPYHPPSKICLWKYQLEPSICVVRCLEHYMTRTCKHRQHQQLLRQPIQACRKSNYRKMALHFNSISRGRCILYRPLH